MSQVIELKDEVFTKLKQKAENDGVTPEVWIEIKVEGIPENGVEIVSAMQRKSWKSFIGAVDSSEMNFENEEKFSVKNADKIFGETVLEKMKKIGLNVPE